MRIAPEEVKALLLDNEQVHPDAEKLESTDGEIRAKFLRHIRNIDHTAHGSRSNCVL